MILLEVRHKYKRKTAKSSLTKVLPISLTVLLFLIPSRRNSFRKLAIPYESRSPLLSARPFSDLLHTVRVLSMYSLWTMMESNFTLLPREKRQGFISR